VVDLGDLDRELVQVSRRQQEQVAMKQGQKPAEPRMEDVLASIRRAIDENAAGMPTARFGGSMAELRVKLDTSPVRESRPRRDVDHPASGSPQQGFAGILGGKRGFEPARPESETFPRRSDPVLSPREDEGQYVYEGYYGAQVVDYPETPAEEPYHRPAQLPPPRYLPPAPVSDHPQSFAAGPLLSESSSEATQAAFNRLAETITRRALGDRPIADITQELLRGMLKQWLDDNLPKIVEQLVREEIERVVRRPQR
jgi:cell pole-organizing protein PopZ